MVELIIKNADTLTVGSLDSNFPIKTKVIGSIQSYWQFIVDSNEIIDKYFRIYRVF